MNILQRTGILLLLLAPILQGQPSLGSHVPSGAALPSLPCSSGSFPNVFLLTSGSTGLYSCIGGSWVAGGGTPGPTGPTGSTGPSGATGATGPTGPGGSSSTVTTVTCANTTGTDDALAIQAAINAAPSQNASVGGGSSTNPVVIQIASGNCLINSTILLNKAGVILKGYNPTHQSVNGSNITNPGTVLINVAGFGGPFIRADAGDVSSPAATAYLRGVGIQDLTFSNFNQTTGLTNGFSSHYQVETGSLSDPAPFSGLTFFQFTSGGILFAPSYTSVITTGTPYDPEGIVLRDFWAVSSATQTVGTSPVLFRGCNQSKAENGRIRMSTCTGGCSTSHTASDIAAIEVDSDVYAQLGSSGITLENISGVGNMVWIRVKGADNTKTQTNGSSCTTIGGCSITATQHVTPTGVTVLHNFVENFNRGIVVGVDDSSSFSGWTINSIRVDSTNRFITELGSSPLIASVNNAAGGEFSLDYSDTIGGIALPAISLGSVTANILSRVPYNISTSSTFPVSSSATNNNCVAVSGPVTFANRPASACPGTTMIFSDGSCASGAVCTGGGSYRGVVWNGSNWVGQ